MNNAFHAFAADNDLAHWTLSPGWPYTLAVDFEGQALPTVFERRERPKLIFAADDPFRPLFLSNGVLEFLHSDSHTLFQPVLS